MKHGQGFRINFNDALGVSSIDVIDGKFVGSLTNGECSDVFVRVFHQLKRFSNSQGVECPKSS